MDHKVRKYFNMIISDSNIIFHVIVGLDSRLSEHLTRDLSLFQAVRNRSRDATVNWKFFCFIYGTQCNAMKYNGMDASCHKPDHAI